MNDANRMRELAAQRIGLKGYAEMLGSIRRHALSSRQLADKHDCDIKAVHQAMRHFLNAGLVHRVDWFRPSPKSRLIPCWLFGGDGDIAMPDQETRVANPRPARSSMLMLSTVLDMLKEHPHSLAEIAESLCMHHETASRVVGILREQGLVYIASWHKPPMGTSVAEWQTGQRKDAPRPPRIGNSVASIAGYKQRREQVRLMQMMAGVPQQSMRAVA